MNARLSKESVVRGAKRILGLAGLASLALVCAGVAWAQSQPTQAPSPSARPVAAATATSPAERPASSAPAVKQGVAQNPAAKRQAPKGQSEGIQVHGHWTIEVRNPDGKLVTHREFENSLVAGPFGGANLLVNILSRTLVTGNWIIVLSTGAVNPFSPTGIEVVESTVTSCVPSGQLTCSNNLAVTCGLTVDGCGPTLTFMGSGLVPSTTGTSPGAIVAVTTENTASGNGYGGFNFTSRLLDGNTPAGAAAGDPNPVAVTPNQTVNVTVTISFQ